MNEESFDQALRQWSRRPGRQEPEEAAKEIVRIVARRRASWWRWAAAASVLATLGTGLYLLPSDRQESVLRNDMKSMIDTDGSHRTLLVVQLSSGSQLYLELGEPSLEKGIEE